MFLVDADVPARPSDEWIAEADLSAAEADALADEGEQFRRKHIDALLSMYAEAGGSPELAEDQPPQVIEGMIEALLEASDLQAGQRRLAQERAGLVAPPSDSSTLSLADRLVREVYGSGDRYESVAAKVLGRERAHELRVLNDGWGAPWGAVGDCEGE